MHTSFVTGTSWQATLKAYVNRTKLRSWFSLHHHHHPQEARQSKRGQRKGGHFHQDGSAEPMPLAQVWLRVTVMYRRVRQISSLLRVSKKGLRKSGYNV